MTRSIPPSPPRTTALFAGPAALLAWSWLRLGQPHARTSTAFWLITLALVPSLLPRLRWRVLVLVPAAVVGLHIALGVWITQPLRLLGRFGHGFLEFYDVRLPFAAASHPRMQSVILVALFVSCVLVGLVIAARRPVFAALTLVVAAGWPATLLSGPGDLRFGAALLAVVLLLLAGLGGPLHTRRVALAGLVGAAVVLAAFAASTSSAIASGEVLHWQAWDFYTKPQKPVGVEYVWNSNYSGLHFPKKVTTVLRIKAPNRSTYWRATTLDQFDGGNWYENNPVEVTPMRIDGRDELTGDAQTPPAGRDVKGWVRQDVTVGALHDNHLIGASVPVAYETGSTPADYGQGGVGYLQDGLSPGYRYSVWSYEAQPTPRQLAHLAPRYPKDIRRTDLYVEARELAPPFGTPNRDRLVAQIFRDSYRASQYEGLYRTAKRVVGDPAYPYAAALELEAWFRSGAFTYDETPPLAPNRPALVTFVLDTRRGYCQYFAGAMALMLRYLGIPARVAAGFTSGIYDRDKHEWIVTDHDAHTWVEAWFPRYGWLPFDPTPGRGSLDGTYTAASPHFDLSDGLLAVAQKLKRPGQFDLRDLRKLGHGGNAKVPKAPAKPRASHGASGSGFGALLKALFLVAVALVGLVIAVKLTVRKQRYLTRDPRKLARACVRELADYAADQGAKAPPSATVRELAKLVEDEIGVSAVAFATAAAEARFGPIAGAREAARTARGELRSVRRQLRSSLSRTERALGLVSLRSLGLTG
jgi:hypothetical protein